MFSPLFFLQTPVFISSVLLHINGSFPLRGLSMDVYLCRYVTSELAADVIIIVGGVKFCLHKV